MRIPLQPILIPPGLQLLPVSLPEVSDLSGHEVLGPVVLIGAVSHLLTENTVNPHFDNITRRPRYSRVQSRFLPAVVIEGTKRGHHLFEVVLI